GSIGVLNHRGQPGGSTPVRASPVGQPRPDWPDPAPAGAANQLLGWDQHGESYHRLRLAFRRLYGVKITAINAFYNANNKRREREQAISIIADYDLVHGEDADPDDGGFPTWISWSPELHRNMRARWIKPLDVEYYLSLRNATAQRIYRYLDLRRGGDDKPVYQEELRTFAFERIGLSRSSAAPSQIKQKLEPAHQELLETGYLQEVSYAPMKTEPGKEQVIYRFMPRRRIGSRHQLVLLEMEPGRQSVAAALTGEAAPPEVLPSPAPALCELGARLAAQGVSRHTAQELVESCPEECRRQLEFLPFREAREPGGLLVKAIREGWAPPAGWHEAEKTKQRREVRQQSRKSAEQETERAAAREAEFDAYWETLPAAHQAELQERAGAQLRKENRVLAEFVSRRPGSPMCREALRPYLKALTGWKNP
ncbi:MAG: hypothetical protein FJX77_10935, partial [Armatimonadetes bacterium]|nr:hypothetical protein [Armatimonadota bacterium]